MTDFLRYAIGKIKISTHTLTWSVTCNVATLKFLFVISTHTLTWSVTSAQTFVRDMVTNFNSHAHVERDRNIFLKT